MSPLLPLLSSISVNHSYLIFYSIFRKLSLVFVSKFLLNPTLCSRFLVSTTSSLRFFVSLGVCLSVGRLVGRSTHTILLVQPKNKGRNKNCHIHFPTPKKQQQQKKMLHSFVLYWRQSCPLERNKFFANASNWKTIFSFSVCVLFFRITGWQAGGRQYIWHILLVYGADVALTLPLWAMRMVGGFGECVFHLTFVKFPQIFFSFIFTQSLLNEDIRCGCWSCCCCCCCY